MKTNKAVTIALLLFVAVAAATMVRNGLKSGQTADSSKQEDAQQQAGSDSVVKSDIDVVYYFMTTQRCPSCMKIEAYAKEAVQSNYANNIENRTLVWKMVNVDEPANRHFIEDYQLHTKSVVLVRYRDGRQVAFKNLDRVWELLGDKAVFQDYVTTEVGSFITEG